MAFRHGDEISLPVTVDTDRPIPRPTLRARLKDAGTLAVVATREWRFDRLEAGRIPQPAVLPASLTARLRAGAGVPRGPGAHVARPQRARRRHDVSADPDRRGADLRHDGHRTASPCGSTTWTRDRAWWHRVWSGQFDADVRRVEADLDYEYRLATGDTNGRRDSVTDLAADGESTRLRGTISSGLDVAIAELSRLAAPADRRVADERGDDRARRRELRRGVRPGRPHPGHRCEGGAAARAAIWVWPEVKVHDVTFQMPDEISPLTGQVLSFTPFVASVPVPAVAHVVTTKSG